MSLVSLGSGIGTGIMVPTEAEYYVRISTSDCVKVVNSYLILNSGIHRKPFD